MNAPAFVIGVPLAAAALLAALPGRAWAARVNALASLATAVAATTLFAQRGEEHGFLLVDDLNVFFAVLTAFVAFTTSWFSAGYIAHEIESGHLTPVSLRFYHAMYQGLTAAMLLALLANNIALMWVAVEAATLITVVMVSIYRTRESIEAAWKYFILGSVGIALALFGTILVYLSAQGAIGEGIDALSWTRLRDAAPRLDAGVLNLAFVCLLIGYGT